MWMLSRIVTPKAVQVDVSGHRIGSTWGSLRELLKLALTLGVAALVCGLLALTALGLLFGAALGGIGGGGGTAALLVLVGVAIAGLLSLLIILFALARTLTHLISAWRLRTPASAIVASALILVIVATAWIHP
jgi:hypothetical protein